MCCIYKNLRETLRCTALAGLLLFMIMAGCQPHTVYMLTSSLSSPLLYKCHYLLCKCITIDIIWYRKRQHYTGLRWCALKDLSTPFESHVNIFFGLI